ncbi:prepilin-type N-terminal cleavage/methylation domain-containing protein [Lentisphaera marina]|uniref:type II secretion system protein n=1 Tax=Lentisphaera marina TaxID=1111041 RepID=UPI002365244D|nr:prepilin-type N-terminal cleavage/methylation domain-containing protein [Lentisphaera marina]MDD7984952.1 prepilin-type N-terminal cleavage/methylation domain-containing protein [Lentisphaera marina]
MKHKKFTLIEILVVVAIIGILASLLLPSLSRARERGKAAVCLSNLKQVGVGTYMYTEDNENLFPIRRNEVWDTYEEYQGVSTKMWECPSDKGNWDNGGAVVYDGRTTYERRGSSYHWNEHAVWGKDMSTTNVTVPKDYVYTGSRAIMGKWGTGSDPANSPDNFMWHMKGELKFSLLFGDGHAKFIYYHAIFETEPKTFNYNNYSNGQYDFYCNDTFQNPKN